MVCQILHFDARLWFRQLVYYTTTIFTPHTPPSYQIKIVSLHTILPQSINIHHLPAAH